MDEEEVKRNVVNRDEQGGATACHAHVQKHKLWVAQEFARKQPIYLVSKERVALGHAEGNGGDDENHNQGDDTAVIPSSNGAPKGKGHRKRNV